MRAAVFVCLLLTGCAFHVKPDPLVIASCPPLTSLADGSFGATTLKLIDVAGQYHKCRCAAVPKVCQ